ncbi:hypothetical protein [Ramlibacter sp.]|uniref:hypothetical protein n=1 Tax=Ramlibacter sp. TaxID=1917967 RepID=UPI00180F63FF|nr:hypothetical protein [Ramlibacter sp.]MBA2672274.1 hypothetical protein [Ramlibacter sp.]
MTNAEFPDAGQHVRQTRYVMDVDLQWDRLLALTHGLAPAGSASLQLILPVLSETVQPNWVLLERTGLSPAAVADIACGLDRELTALATWSQAQIARAIASTSASFGVAADTVSAVAGVFVVGEVTRLPLAGLCELMGRDRVLQRLRAAARAYASMQMVG